MLFSKKALGPVVAMGLLLVVAVSGVVGFQTWYQTYQSGLMSDVEESSSSTFDGFTFEAVSNDNLYLKSGVADNLTSFKIVDVSGNEMCSFSGTGDVNSSGLVGHWKFNDDSSVIEDLSGNGNNGTLYGNSRFLLNFDDGTATDLTAYGNDGVLQNGVDCSGLGVSGQGCSFDGVDDYINMTNSISFSNSFSISFWVNFNELNKSQFLFTKGSAATDEREFVFDISNTNYLSFIWQKNDSNGLPVRKVDSEMLSISDNSYNHLTLTYNSLINTNNGSDRVAFYLNGNKLNSFLNASVSQWASIPNITMTSKPLLFGSYFNSSVNMFNGSIDEVGVYSKVLTSSEISDLYNSQKAKFVEFKDSNLDKSVLLDGVDTYVNLVNFSNMINGSDALTISAKVKLHSFDRMLRTPHIFSIYSGNGAQRQVSLGVGETGVVYGTVLNSTGDYGYTSSSSNLVTLNQWEDLFLIYNGTTFNLYFNNLLVDSSPFIGSLISINRPARIGWYERQVTEDPDNYLPAYIDEIRVYNRSLSAQERENLYWYSIKSQETGVNTIDVTSCNLVKGSRYNFVSFTDENKVDSYFIAK